MSTSPSAAVLRHIVELATRAPSIHNTQPWRWRTTPGGLELHADPNRQLVVADPIGRNLVISCGTSLHQALVAAAALGWRAEVERLPEGPSSSLLARISLRRAAPSETAQADLRAIEERCTDRRRFTSWPVPDERLQHLAHEAELHGAHAIPLVDPSLRFRAELLVARAADLQSSDASVTAEQRSWVDHSSVDGIPTAVLPAERPAMAGGHPSRFPQGLLSEPDREVDGSDGLIVLYGADDPPTWLGAGEGLSALWLLATTQGLSVVPLSQVIEVDETRSALQQEVLGGLAVPHLLVRLGWQALSRSRLEHTARRPVDEVFGDS